jgi:hypothetical protein
VNFLLDGFASHVARSLQLTHRCALARAC